MPRMIRSVPVFLVHVRLVCCCATGGEDPVSIEASLDLLSFRPAVLYVVSVLLFRPYQICRIEFSSDCETKTSFSCHSSSSSAFVSSDSAVEHQCIINAVGIADLPLHSLVQAPIVDKNDGRRTMRVARFLALPSVVAAGRTKSSSQKSLPLTAA